MNNKFAVIICTYYRKNNSSYKNLLNIHNFLMSQTYQNFKIFLIGDDYTKKNEFIDIVNLFPKDKLYSYNNNKSYRDNYFKLNHNKWSCGGMASRYIGIKQALKENFKYYLHLDDDDFWTNNHIKEINNVINAKPQVDFLVSKSKYRNRILPREFTDKTVGIEYNNFIPKPANSVHSSWTINLQTLGNELIELYQKRIECIGKIKKNKINEKLLPAFDKIILNKINKLQCENKIKCIYIDKCTVTKKTDINIPK
jgi:hypothetical protein